MVSAKSKNGVLMQQLRTKISVLYHSDKQERSYIITCGQVVPYNEVVTCEYQNIRAILPVVVFARNEVDST